MNSEFSRQKLIICPLSVKFFLAAFFLLTCFYGKAFGASFKISTNADFRQAGSLFENVVASDTNGVSADYLRLRNANPGMDDGFPALKFGGRGNWSKKRMIAFTVPLEYNTAGAAVSRAQRFGEKVQIDLTLIGSANDDWSDLRLTDWAGVQIPFRLLDFERPVDNAETPVKLLFEADAHPSWAAASNTYHLYYANPDALNVEDNSISRFYIANHDFEDNLNGWYFCPRGRAMASADGLAPNINNTNSNATLPLVDIENGLSIIPSGYVGFDSKACLSVGYPESTVYPLGAWRAVSQTITGPSSGTYVLTAQRRFASASYTQGWYSLMFMQTLTAGRDRRYFISSGFTDWMETSVDFTLGNTRTVEIGLGMVTNIAGSAQIRERRCNFDWAELSLKYPLQSALSAESTAGYYDSATYTSRVFDTGVANPTFESLTWSANTTAQGTMVSFQTRTAANIGGPFSAWSAPVTINGDTITSPSNRYIQVRALLNTDDTTFSPILNEIEIFYNLPVTSFRIDAPATADAGGYFDFRVTAVNQTGATATQFVGNLTVSADSANVEFPRLSLLYSDSEQGTAVFQARNPIAETFRIIGTSGVISSQSQPIQTLPGETTQLELRLLPVSVIAGQLFSGQIVALDRYGNIDTANNGLFAVSSNDNAPGSFPVSLNAVNGVASMVNCALFTIPDRRIMVQEASSGLATWTDILVNAGVASKLRLTAEPDQYKDKPFNLQVLATDNYNNVNTSINTTFNLTSSSGSVSPNLEAINSGVGSISPSLDATGTITITAITPTLLTGNIGINVYPTPPPTLNRFLIDAGYDQLAGVPFTLTIEARDNNEEVLTSYSGACRIIPSVGQCSPSMTTGYKFLDGFMAIPITLSGASDTVILRVEDIKDNSKIGLLFLNVRPAGLSKFEVEAPPSADAGATFTFKITARDNQGNLLTNYTGSVNISHTATGGAISLPAGYTFTTADGGIKEFSGLAGARFTKAEKIQIQVEDSGKVGLSNFVEIKADETQPVLTLQPDKLSVDLGNSLSFNLTVRDIFENPLNDFTGAINFSYSDPSVVGPANYNFQSFENGFKRFLQVVTPANLGSFTITALEPLSGESFTTDLITVISGQTTNFTFNPGAISRIAGQPFSFNVTASNTAGNLNEQYNGAVRFSTMDTKALVPQDSTLVNGQGTFNSTFYTAGNFQLSALDIQDPAVTGSMSVTVQASAPRFLEFDILAPGFTTAAGVAFNYTVKIVDSFGNLASYTGNVTVSSTDIKATSTPPQVFVFANQATRSGLWTLTTSGAQKLRVTAPGLTQGISLPVMVVPGAAAAITGDFPTSVSSELIVPFYVRIVDAFGNPTPSFTSEITVASTGSGFSGSNYTFSAADNGAHTFFLRWDRGTNPPQNMTVTFNRNPVASIPATGAPLVLNVYLDNPRNAGATYPFMRSWLSKPDRSVIASEPFQMMYKSFSIKETAASITSIIDFTMSDGDFQVSRDGITYGKTITLTNESIVPFFARVTRTGYLSMVASPRIAPRLTGTVSFVSQPGPISKVTLKADTPQKAGQSFPWTAEWWDLNDNYARKATDTLSFFAVATGTHLLDPDRLILSGKTGSFNQSTNNVWLTNDFIVASNTSNLKVDLMRQEISIGGTFDEDFSLPALNYGSWLTQNFGNSNGSFNLTERQLLIGTIGTGILSNHASPNSTAATAANWYEDNANDGYFYLYFDWPANDIFAFTATISVNRIWYDAVLDYSRSHIGIMMRDDSSLTQPAFVCTMLRRTDNLHVPNREIGVFLAQAVYRNAAMGRRFRRKVANEASTVTTHPKWLRLSRDNSGVFSPQYSPDGNSWLQLSSSPFNTPATDPDPDPAFDNATLKLGITVAAGSATRQSIAWLDDFTINRYPQNASYTSVVYDTGTSTVTFTNPITISGSLNTGTLRFFGRASNNAATVGTLPWVERPLAWAGNQATANPGVFNNNRYIQYALLFGAHVAGTNGGQTFYDATPVVNSVTINYAPAAQGANFAAHNVEPPAIIIASISPTINAETEVAIQGGTVTGLEVTVPASVTAGVPFTISVRAVDTFGNTADDYDKTWSFTTTDGAPFSGIVPGDYTLVPAADKGLHTFYNASILYNGPNRTIQVTDGTLTTISNPIIVNPGPIGAFSVFAGTPHAASTIFTISLQALDIYTNLKTDYSGTLKFTDDKSGGVSVYNPINLLPADWLTGEATLTPGVSFTKAETVKITAQGSNRSGLSNPVEITNAASANLIMSVSTSSPDSGVPFSVTVTALDNFGNVAKDYLGKVNFSCNDPHPAKVLPADYQFTLVDAGTKTFTSSVMLITPGAVNLKVVDTVTPTLTYQFPLTVLPGPATSFELSCNTIQTAGVPFNLFIKVFDDYGNLKTNFSESINLITSFTSVLPVSAGGFSNGQLLIPSVELDESGALPADKNLRAWFAGVSGDKTVTLLPPSTLFDRFDMETIPTEPIVGDAFKLVIKAVGPDGAVYTNYAGSGVYLSASNSIGLAVIPPMAPEQASGFTNGVKEIYARNWEAGLITLWAADKSIAGKIGSLTVNFLPTNLSHFSVVPGTSTAEPYANNYYQAINGSFPVFLTAYDSIGNIKTDYSGTVKISTNGTGSISVTEATFFGGMATIPALVYNDFGRMRLTANDDILIRSGTSGYLYFYGPLDHFEISSGYHQTDEVAFLTQFRAIDIYGQEKHNHSGAVNTEKLTWSLGPLAQISITPLSPPVNWLDGFNYAWLTVDRSAAGADIGTFTYRVKSFANPLASGTSLINVHKTSPLVATKMLIETFSPQLAGEPFPMAIKAVDNNNAVVTTWSGDTTVLATSTLGVNGNLNFNFISAADFVDGVYATDTAIMANTGTYTVSATSGALSGQFSPLFIKPGPIAAIKITLPPYAPLNAPFSMSVSGLAQDGTVKTDYIPEGPVQLALNATSTGYLGIQFIDPDQFINGEAQLTTQTYNKSQIIWITARDNVMNLQNRGGPVYVFGPPVRIVLQPQPSISADFFWRNYFLVKVSIKDINGYLVANFAGDINFQVLPGTVPTATDAFILPSLTTQYLDSASLGSKDFFLKIDYSTTASPINLKLGAINPDYSLSTVTDDVKFWRVSVFDHFKIDSPASGSFLRKKSRYNFTVTAISNFDLPIILAASYPQFLAELVEPVSLVDFSASPTSPLEFVGVSTVTQDGSIYYEDRATASVRLTVTPQFGYPGSDSVLINIVEGYDVKDSVYQMVATSTFSSPLPDRYILSAYVSPGTGSAELKFTLINEQGKPEDSYGLRIASDSTITPIGTIVSLGKSEPFVMPGTLPGEEITWYRVYFAFDYRFESATASDTIIHLQNSTPSHYTASATVLFDGVQLERGINPNQTRPTSYSPNSRKLVSPNMERTISGQQSYYEW